MSLIAAVLLAFGGQQTTFADGYEVDWSCAHVVVSVYVSGDAPAVPDSLNVLVIG